MIRLENQWKTIRSGFMFGLAFVFSPCCVPLILPLILTAIVGTPLSWWIGSHLGWVYGGFTLLSLMSAVIGIRWMRNRGRRRSGKHTSTIIVPEGISVK